jgi:hypothetical protein
MVVIPAKAHSRQLNFFITGLKSTDGLETLSALKGLHKTARGQSRGHAARHPGYPGDF